MRHGCEPFHVGEKRRDLAGFATELEQVGLLDDPLHDRGREMLLETVAHQNLAAVGHRERRDDRDDEDDGGGKGRDQRIDQPISQNGSNDGARPGQDNGADHRKRS
jgi:hypothetical protein